eukprot:maker-scaffold_24-snap-gene-1.24-mRNA-1 protein AED:0.00 eAED:0.00 QI:37/1/1/1/1/1/2/28/412
MWKISGNKNESFISRYPSNKYPATLNQHIKLLENLQAAIKTGNLITIVNQLPELKIEDDWSRDEYESAFRVIAMLYNACFHAHNFNKEVNFIPNCVPGLSKNLEHLAIKIERQPTLDYGSYILSNYTLLDISKPLSFENIHILHTFTKDPAEAAFIKVQILVEHAGRFAAGSILNHIKNTESQKYSAESIVEVLEDVSTSLDEMKHQFGSLSKKCTGQDFFNKIRPWIGSIGPKFPGTSGAQSTLVPLIDLFLNVPRKGELAKQFMSKEYIGQLQTFVAAMPPEHRKILHNFKENYSILGFLNSGKFTEGERKRVQDEHEKCIEKLVSFRKFHLSMARSYISKQAEKNGMDGSKGTGGTSFLNDFNDQIKATAQTKSYIISHRQENRLSWFQMVYRFLLYIIQRIRLLKKIQ